MIRQFLDISIRAHDPDDATLSKLQACSMQMATLALQPSVTGVEHTLEPMTGVKYTRVLGVNQINLGYDVDERKRRVCFLHAKIIVSVDEPEPIVAEPKVPFLMRANTSL